MEVPTDSFRALTDQLDALTARVDKFDVAALVTTINEVMRARTGLPSASPSRGRAGRHRHLRPVDGGRP